MDALDIELALALEAVPSVEDVYRLDPLPASAFDARFGPPFEWAVLLVPYSGHAIFAAQEAMRRVLGRARMARVTILDGQAEHRLLSRGKRLLLTEADRASFTARSGLNVLLVADDPAVARRVASALDETGVTVGLASGVEDTRAAIGAHAPDLIILDGALVGMHAAVICDWLADTRPDLLARVRVSLAGAPHVVLSRLAVHPSLGPIPRLDEATLVAAIADIRGRNPHR